MRKRREDDDMHFTNSGDDDMHFTNSGDDDMHFTNSGDDDIHFTNSGVVVGGGQKIKRTLSRGQDNLVTCVKGVETQVR